MSKSKTVTKVYKYGLRPPTKNAQLLEDQLLFGSRYYNDLVETYRWEAMITEKILEKYQPYFQAKVKIDAATKELGEIKKKINNLRIANKKKASDEEKELHNPYKNKEKERDAAYKEKWAAKQAILPKKNDKQKKANEEVRNIEVRNIGKEIENLRNFATKYRNDLYKTKYSGKIWWGSRGGDRSGLQNDARKAYETKKVNFGLFTEENEKFNKKSLMKFHRHGNSEYVMTRIDPKESLKYSNRKRMYAEDIFTGNPTNEQFKMDPIEDLSMFDDPNIKSYAKKKKIKDKCRTTCYIRLGSQKEKGIKKAIPVWVGFPMIYHRPLPEKAELLSAQVTRKWEPNHYKYNLAITVKEKVSKINYKQKGRWACDLGWRHSNGSLRVGYSYDGNEAKEILLNDRIPHRIAYANDLQANQDTHIEILKERLKNLETPLTSLELPGWSNRYKDKLKRIQQWKSKHGFYKLYEYWTMKREEQGETTPAEDTAYEILKKWASHHKRLNSEENANRRKARRHRKHQFREFAAKITKQYKEIVFEDINIGDLAKHKNIIEDIDRAYGQHNRTIASPGEFRDIMKSFAAKNGARFYVVEAKNTSRTCPNCRSYLGEIGAALRVTCPKCDKEYDRDFVGAYNIFHKSPK